MNGSAMTGGHFLSIYNNEINAVLERQESALSGQHSKGEAVTRYDEASMEIGDADGEKRNPSLWEGDGRDCCACTNGDC